jgi:hypothetical protein
MITVKKEVLTDLGCRVFEAVGVSKDEAAWVTDCLVLSNLKGVDSHGVQQIPGYVKNVQNGQITPGAQMKIVRETPAVTIIDGFGGFGYSIAKQAMEVTIKKARAIGVAFSGLHRLGHIGQMARDGVGTRHDWRSEPAWRSLCRSVGRHRTQITHQPHQRRHPHRSRQPLRHRLFDGAHRGRAHFNPSATRDEAAPGMGHRRRGKANARPQLRRLQGSPAPFGPGGVGI